MDQIYVTGHRNPDTDSVVSAMAYAALRNALGDRQYTAARLGHLSDETRAILDRFGFEAPLLIKNMRTQVQDLEFDVPPILHEAVTVGALEEAIRKGARGLLKEVSLFDVYRGKGVDEGKKSVAFNLVLRADDRSLTSEEADEDVKSILETLKADCGAVLR